MQIRQLLRSSKISKKKTIRHFFLNVNKIIINSPEVFSHKILFKNKKKNNEVKKSKNPLI